MLRHGSFAAYTVGRSTRNFGALKASSVHPYSCGLCKSAFNMLTLTRRLVPPYIVRLPHQQGWQAPDLHPHCQGCFDRGFAHGPHPAYLQAFCWSYGPAAPQTVHQVNKLAREAATRDPEPNLGPPSAQLPQGHAEFRCRSRSLQRLHREPEPE